MKIILSRKGFDSANGGVPSPIFPDGNLISLPIPATNTPTSISDININGQKTNKIISDLTNNKIHPTQNVHVDPDIDYQMLKNRLEGWRGAFGQVGAAQSHLSKNCVGEGDLFIYFGWFKEVEQQGNLWRYKYGAPDLHAIYGWLFVDEVLPIYGMEKEILKKYPWLNRHPHLYNMNDIQNTIYVGGDTMPPMISNTRSGYGTFNNIRDVQILTDTNQKNRSVWTLPNSFYPSEGKPPLTYHSSKNRWKIIDNKKVRLSSVGRGQEFILDTDYYPDVNIWLNELLS